MSKRKDNKDKKSTPKHDDWFTSDSPKAAPVSKKAKNSSPSRFSFSKLAFWKQENKNSTKRGNSGKEAGKLKKAFNSSVVWTNNVMRKITSKKLLMKVLYTLIIITIFRIATSITVPGVYVDSKFADDSSSFIGIMNMMGGGALKKFSIVALGITPYITASIIMMLLQSEAFPAIHRLSKSGPKGKRKINMITRWVTLGFAVLTAITMVQQFTSNAVGLVHLKSNVNSPVFKFFILPLILIGGSMFTLFLGEQITEKGVGNGTSLIIFSGIAANLPTMFNNAWLEIVGKASSSSAFVGVMNFVIYTAVFVLFLFIILYIYKAERQVPIQQTGSGMTTDRKQMSRLPIKLNPGGVMPIIFAMMIMTLPLQIVQFFHHQNEFRQWVETHLTFTAPLGLSLVIIFVFVFTIAMSFVTFNPESIASNFKKQGTFIPGLNPGEETEKYLTGVVLRLSIFSGIYLSIISAMKYVMQIMGMSPVISYGGTTIIILVTVAIETLQQLKARDTSRKITKANTKARAASNKGGAKDEEVKGLLW